MSFTNDTNQSDSKTPVSTCACQKHVFDAISQFIAEHGFPLGGEGMIVEICGDCYEQDGDNLILRPETSATDPSDNLAFYVSNDFTGKTKTGYEMFISFHTKNEDEDEDEMEDKKSLKNRRKVRRINLFDFIH